MLFSPFHRYAAEWGGTLPWKQQTKTANRGVCEQRRGLPRVTVCARVCIMNLELHVIAAFQKCLLLSGNVCLSWTLALVYHQGGDIQQCCICGALHDGRSHLSLFSWWDIFKGQCSHETGSSFMLIAAAFLGGNASSSSADTFLYLSSTHQTWQRCLETNLKMIAELSRYNRTYTKCSSHGGSVELEVCVISEFTVISVLLRLQAHIPPNDCNEILIITSITANAFALVPPLWVSSPEDSMRALCSFCRPKSLFFTKC